ncbi:MAG TPA: hypothetical protein VM869_13240, partial [Enhygromyxa sp.]|nr:hypothetical protein [Enhygromyxa sp.]
LRADFRLPAQIHTTVGRELALPRPRGATIAETVSLLERRGSGFRRVCDDALELAADGMHVRGLEPGHYLLTYKLDGQSAEIRVGNDDVVRGWSISARRQLALTRADVLRICGLELDDQGLQISIGGLSKSTRVHVFASRFVPDRDARAALDHARLRSPELLPAVGPARSHYLSGRDIGDEYRYILDRKRAEVFPGNMLERPGLLLNPWALRTTSTGLAVAAAGSAYAAADEPSPDMYLSASAGPQSQAMAATSSNLDFLPAPACVVLNLRPDEHGRVTVPREQLGDATLLRVVAVDAISQAAAELALPESELAPRDRRLLDALDPAGHFVLRKQRACLAPDDELVIDDVRTAKLEAVDSLGKAHALLLTLSGDAHLREFEFVTRWPTLTPEQKRERYSKYACHELHLFLARKDPEFFAAIVQPYLANKRDPTFMDHYLLGAPLDGYLEPWAYGRLNTLERILLAERMAGERGVAARHIGDRFDLLPPEVEVDNAAFDTALKGSALASEKTIMFEPATERERGVGTRGGGGFGGPPPPPAPGGFAPPPAPAAAPAPRPAAPARAAMVSRKRSAPREEAKLMEAEELSVDDDISRGDLAARDEVRRFFQALDKTEEWAENNYYRRLIAEQGPELIGVNAFWRDFAGYVAAGSVGPFLSGQFVIASSCFAEMLCALAVLDLPFDATAPERRLDAQATLRARTPMIVFHQQLAAVAPSEQRIGVLVSQNYFRADDRYRYEDNERHDKYVSGELLVHTVYVCQVVLTNPSSSAHKLDLLVQIPRGAVPVANGFETRDLHVHLPPRGTHAIEYAFYFPAPGRFEHFPVHVAKREALVAFAEPTTLEVVTRLRSVDTESWSHVSQQGTDAELLAFLEANNIDRLALDRIAWRMRERELFEATLALLRRRHVYSDVLWSYALHHHDALALGEYLRQQEGFVRGCGLALESALVRTQPVERRWYQHLEYAPLVNARTHQLGHRRKILNSALEQQYRGFLQTLTYCARPSDDQLVVAAYYALLQDRTREALALLDRVTPERVTGRLQWDYLQAYVALYRDDLATARQLAERHREHGVPRWRKRFANLLAVLDEAEGAAATVVDADDRQQQQARLAATEASFDFEVEGDTLVISYQNLSSCELSFYLMDIELLFSRQPFMQDQSDRFAIVEPNISVPLGLSASPTRIRLPEQLRSANSIIEIVAGGVRRSKANYANDLAVRVIEQYGQLRVHERSSGRALARAYVKVYARKHGGGVDFYKDGYTDLRGAFDYASLSTNELDHVERFAILVMSDARGALIREAARPQR